MRVRCLLSLCLIALSAPLRAEPIRLTLPDGAIRAAQQSNTATLSDGEYASLQGLTADGRGKNRRVEAALTPTRQGVARDEKQTHQ